MNQTSDHSSLLEKEAKYFYQKIFPGQAPQQIIEKYVAANQQLLPGSTGQDAIAQLVNKKADIEAIEIAWRFHARNNILTKKIHILVYLVETTPEHFHNFVEIRKRRILSYFVMGYHLIRSIYKLIKGKILLKSYQGRKPS